MPGTSPRRVASSGTEWLTRSRPNHACQDALGADSRHPPRRVDWTLAPNFLVPLPQWSHLPLWLRLHDHRETAGAPWRCGRAEE